MKIHPSRQWMGVSKMRYGRETGKAGRSATWLGPERRGPDAYVVEYAVEITGVRRPV